jgi:hypothetical protein
LRFKT